MNEPIKIDRGIPVPRAKRKGPPRLYPFNDMEVNDSFFISGKKMQVVSSACCRHGNRNGIKFSVRTVTENGVKGVRFWRVS